MSLWIERMKRLVRDAEVAPHPDAPGAPPAGSDSAGATVAACRHHSHALAEFVAALTSQPGQCVLDFGELSQDNVAFLTNLGYKLYSEALLRTLDADPALNSQDGEGPDESRIFAFLKSTLDFPPAHLDGVLLWDTLEFLPPKLLKAVISRLHQVLKPGGVMLAFFHADERSPSVPVYCCRIFAADTLFLTVKCNRPPVQRFNNRAIEKMFQQFHAVKFFLARDYLREVIIRR